jgi:hypothetical protein
MFIPGRHDLRNRKAPIDPARLVGEDPSRFAGACRDTRDPAHTSSPRLGTYSTKGHGRAHTHALPRGRRPSSRRCQQGLPWSPNAATRYDRTEQHAGQITKQVQIPLAGL